MDVTLYAGPYARWLTARPVSLEAWFDEAANANSLEWNLGGGDVPPRVKHGRALRYEYCCMPSVGLPDREQPAGLKPPRDGLWVRITEGVYPDSRRPDDRFAVDLTAADSRAEVDWFRQAFAAELAELARHFGGPPTLHWGLVYVAW